MLQVEDFGPVQALHQGRPLLGLFPPYMTVRCYSVDGLMVDSGLRSFGDAAARWARERKVTTSVLTHHHEDHSGGANFLQAEGVEVLAARATRAIVERGFSVHFYQRVVWGPARPTRLGPLGEFIETERYRFEVWPAPGHCDDQIVLYERDQGWLFSGDAFIGRRIKYFRGDEDFQATVASLRSLCQLEFDSLFCAHRPILKGGRQSLQDKLQYLLDLEGRTRELHGQGLSIRQITSRLLGNEPWLIYLASLGDLSKYNLIRSILHGPKPRAGFA